MKEKVLLIILIIFTSCKGDVQIDGEDKKTKEMAPSQNGVIIKNYAKNTIVGKNEGVLFLKNFYSKFYFDDNKHFTFSDQKEFISKRINNRLDSLNSNPESIELDYDPFIKAQDFYGERIKNTIKFTKETKGFIVAYTNFEEEGEVRLEFELGRNKEGEIEISNILNDSILNIK